MTTFSINSKLIAAASIFTAVEGVRWYLKGILVQPCSSGGLLVIGTDGAQLFVGRDPNGVAKDLPAGGIILSISKDIIKACKLHKHNEFKWEGPNRGAIPSLASIGGSTFTAPAIDGRFPQWQTVMPSAPPAPRASIDPKYLKSIAVAAGLLKAKYCTMVCREKGASSFNLTGCQKELSAYTILMTLPAKDASDRPKWLTGV